MGRFGAAGSVLLFAMEALMSAFVGLPWGRYVYVQPYVNSRSGKWVKAHLRQWPGTKANLYFSY